MTQSKTARGASDSPRRRRSPLKAVRGLFGGHDDGELVAVLELTGVMWREGDEWVSQCLELDIASSGRTSDEAYEQLTDALCAYLNTLEELGEREQVLKERGIPVFPAAPLTGVFHPSIPREYMRHEGAQIRSVEVPVTRDLVPA